MSNKETKRLLTIHEKKKQSKPNERKIKIEKRLKKFSVQAPKMTQKRMNRIESN